jgi:cell division protein FtsQ
MAGADYVGERRWNVTFDNGIVVKLPEENPELAWRVLGTLEKRDRILERRIAIIDLRLPDRMFVELPSAPLHGSPVSGKEI